MTRHVVLAVLWLGVVGTGIELLLLKHFDGAWQIAPLALLACGVVALAVLAAVPRPGAVRALQLVMAIFVVSGAIGVLLHYRGNVEWELDRVASLRGFDLFKAAIMGATPALAPGTMVQLGIVGLLYSYLHPAARRGTTDHQPFQSSS